MVGAEINDQSGGKWSDSRELTVDAVVEYLSYH